jgi:hypothetical protein
MSKNIENNAQNLGNDKPKEKSLDWAASDDEISQKSDAVDKISNLKLGIVGKEEEEPSEATSLHSLSDSGSEVGPSDFPKLQSFPNENEDDISWPELADQCQSFTACPSTNNRVVESHLGVPVITLGRGISSELMQRIRRDVSEKRGGKKGFTRMLRASGCVAVPIAYEKDGYLKYALPRPQGVLSSSDGDRVRLVQRGTPARNVENRTAFLTMDKLIAYVPDKYATKDVLMALPCETFPEGSILVNLNIDYTQSKAFAHADRPWSEFELFEIAFELMELIKEKKHSPLPQIDFDIYQNWQVSHRQHLSPAQLTFLERKQIGCLPDSLEAVRMPESMQSALVKTLVKEGAPSELIDYIRNLGPSDFMSQLSMIRDDHPDLFSSRMDAIGADVSVSLPEELTDEGQRKARQVTLQACNAPGSHLRRENDGVSLIISTPTLSTDLSVKPIQTIGATEYLADRLLVKTMPQATPTLTEALCKVGRQVLNGTAKLVYVETEGRITTLLSSARPNANHEQHVGGKIPDNARWQERLDNHGSHRCWLPFPTPSANDADVIFTREVSMLVFNEMLTALSRQAC